MIFVLLVVVAYVQAGVLVCASLFGSPTDGLCKGTLIKKLDFETDKCLTNVPTEFSAFKSHKFKMNTTVSGSYLLWTDDKCTTGQVEFVKCSVNQCCTGTLGTSKFDTKPEIGACPKPSSGAKTILVSMAVLLLAMFLL